MKQILENKKQGNWKEKTKMNGTQFSNYYLNSTRVGKDGDLKCFYNAWKSVYGYYFNDSTPWNSKDPAFKVPKVCSKIRTKMLSMGATSATADRVINSFKKWYKDTCE